MTPSRFVILLGFVCVCAVASVAEAKKPEDVFAGRILISDKRFPTQSKSVGAYISAAGLVVFFIGLAYAFIRKEKAANNPWGPGATTLEWTLSSPPPFHQFEMLPRIK